MKPFQKYLAGLLVLVAILATAVATYAQGDPPRRPGPPPPPGGEVTAVSATGFTLQTRKPETLTVHVGAETHIILLETQTEGSLSDIHVGAHVQVEGRPGDNGVIEARRVTVEPAGDRAEGRVTTVSGQMITAQSPEGQATIVTDASTRFYQGRDAATLADVTVGKGVTAYGQKQADGSLRARLVFIHDGPPDGPRPTPTGPRPTPGPRPTRQP